MPASVPEHVYHVLLREMQNKQSVLALWSPHYVAIARELIEDGLAREVGEGIIQYAKPPKLVIQITDAGRKTRVRKLRWTEKKTR